MQGHAALDRGLDGAHALGVVGRAVHPRHPHAAEAEGEHLGPGGAQLHGSSRRALWSLVIARSSVPGERLGLADHEIQRIGCMGTMRTSYGKDLDLNLLRVFVVVAEAGSVTAAASRLYLTQPAVSAALRRLAHGGRRAAVRARRARASRSRRAVSGSRRGAAAPRCAGRRGAVPGGVRPADQRAHGPPRSLGHERARGSCRRSSGRCARGAAHAARGDPGPVPHGRGGARPRARSTSR